jgi:hypothetical protein
VADGDLYVRIGLILTGKGRKDARYRVPGWMEFQQTDEV